MQIGIYDHSTGEDIVRDMTAEEIAQYEVDQAAEAVHIANVEAELATKATAKAALLAQLGITEEQAKLLLS
jgi:hypothetical protein